MHRRFFDSNFKILSCANEGIKQRYGLCSRSHLTKLQDAVAVGDVSIDVFGF
ncbi:hypothetical protein CY34DRAFT_805378 [Suillus luteus UH-Slu-Lm8-n1]|uniref:Uncharacterized protein n=1 Tax=Suillus luteus UH-Slu-Lm8-n1 TaxID=930992 RepID=A0A0D0BFG3_9AGAM|nr:hypothetical protein CY34DRAFT_805378 [Suillus luteus UH-Slu-Lm8-n1]